MIDWIAPALISPFLFSVVTLIDKRVLSSFRVPLSSFNLFVGASQGTFGVIILIASPLPSVSAAVILSGLGVGVLQGLGLVIMFWMLRREDPSRVIPAMQTSPIFVALLAWPLFDEALGGLQWLAVFMAVGGAVLVSVNLSGKASGPLFRPIFLLLIFSSFMTAVSQLLVKSTIDDLGITQIVALRGLGLFGTMWIIFARPAAINGLVRFLRDPKRAPWLVLAEGFMPFAGHMLNVIAISLGPVALVAALFGTRPVWVFLGSLTLSRFAPRLVYEEFTRRELPIKFGAAAMMVAAITLISIG